MAKRMSAPCMFCGGLPCVCDGVPTPKAAKPRRTQTPKVSDVTLPSADSVKDTEDVFGEIPEPAKPKFKSASHSERDLSFESAIRNLLDADMLSHQDAARMRREIAHPYPQDVDKRVAQWKASHGKQ